MIHFVSDSSSLGYLGIPACSAPAASRILETGAGGEIEAEITRVDEIVWVERTE